MNLDGTKISILDCVPTGITLRPAQVEFLLQFEKDYESHDVFVGRLAVAVGKSIIAIVIADWLDKNHMKSTAIITPNKMLQTQYNNDFPWLPVLKGAANYTCGIGDGMNCAQTKRILGKYCPGCVYTQAVRAAKEATTAIANFHSYYYSEAYKDVLQVDEGHNAINFIYSLFGAKLWEPEFKFGDTEVTAPNIVSILNNHIDELDENKRISLVANNTSLADKLDEKIESYKKVAHVLKLYPDDTIIKLKEDKYYGDIKELKGTVQKYIYIKPLKLQRICQSILWPQDKVKKVIFLSATIYKKDIETLGLNERKVAYYECDSPIPVENRPIIAWPVANMAYKNRKESVPIIAEAIDRILAKFPTDKGLIHCTYDTAKALRGLLGDRRLMFHNELNKQQIYESFRGASGPAVLVASGMSEGIDLPDDAARWQVITQVMYPNLGDDVNMWYCKNDPTAYQLEAVRAIEQQTGRICRHMEDKGTTIILDLQFKDLLNRTHHARIAKGKESLWSRSFIAALK